MHGFNAGDLRLFQNVDIGDKVTPDGAEAALMKALKESYVVTVGYP